MFLEVLTGTLLGVALGAVSGLVPGVHSNTMAAFLLAFHAPVLAFLGPAALATALMGALITHTFLDVIPSTFIGVPDPDTALSVLPAHRLCLEGHGEEVIRISALGSALSVVLSLPIFFAFLLLLPPLQESLDFWIGCIVLLISGLLIVRTESPPLALLLFCVSGALGVFTLRYSYLGWSVGGSSGLLMPLLSGLFGVPALLTATGGTIPVQKHDRIHLSGGEVFRGTVLGTAAGALVGWLPGLSTATANGLLASFVQYDRERRTYILATSAANTANAMIGLSALYAVARMRNGVMVALSALELPSLWTMLGGALLASFLAYALAVAISGSASLLGRVQIGALNRGVLLFIPVLTLLLTGPFGIAVLVLATATGLATVFLNIPRMFLMGAVMVPVILFSFQLPLV